jgi:tripartite-type tricarboxylate transporter receptor subunit TctC
MDTKSYCALILASAIAAPIGGAVAQEFPSKNLRLVAPFPPGGTVDLLARVLGQPLSRALGQNVIVENRPGGNTVIGAELVMRAPADGHTLLLMASSFTINPLVRSKMPYDTLKDFTGVTRIASNPLVISVHPSLPAKTIKELVALARVRPGELTFGTASIIGGQRLAMELLFREAAGVDLINIPYNGGAPAATAVMGGHTSMLIANISESAPHIASHRLRGIAVTSLARSDILPAVPTVAESGYPGFEALNWFGAVARSATPRPAIERLNAEIARALQLPEVKDVLGKEGLVPAATSPQEFDAFMQEEMRKYGRIIKALKIRIE